MASESVKLKDSFKKYELKMCRKNQKKSDKQLPKENIYIYISKKLVVLQVVKVVFEKGTLWKYQGSFYADVNKKAPSFRARGKDTKCSSKLTLGPQLN